MLANLKRWATLAARAAAVAVLVLAIGWVASRSNFTALEGALAIGSAVLFAAALWRFGEGFAAPAMELSEEKASGPKVYILLGVWVLALAGFFIGWAFREYPGLGVQAIERLWGRINIDAHHYIEIAKRGYTAALDGTDLHYYIVFYPLYPLLLRAMSYITGGWYLAGMAANCLSAYTGGLVFYKLALALQGRQRAAASTLFLCVFPAAFFFAAPMTEGLFLLLSAAFFLALIKKKHVLAAGLGFLAALCRNQGMLLAVPLAVEAAHSLAHGKMTLKQAVKTAICAIGPVLGFGVYLLINYIVYGNFFQFMEIQREHWYNSMDWFWNTAAYQGRYIRLFLGRGDWKGIAGLMGPNAIALWGCLALLIKGAKTQRPALTAYGLAYFAMSFGATWLLSGPRYLACLLPLHLTAGAAKSKAGRLAMIGVYMVLFALYLYVFTQRWEVY